MQVELPADLEAFVREKVADGGYPSVVEVIREGLRLLRERDDQTRMRLERLNQSAVLEECIEPNETPSADGPAPSEGRRKSDQH